MILAEMFCAETGIGWQLGTSLLDATITPAFVRFTDNGVSILQLTKYDWKALYRVHVPHIQKMNIFKVAS